MKSINNKLYGTETQIVENNFEDFIDKIRIRSDTINYINSRAIGIRKHINKYLRCEFRESKGLLNKLKFIYVGSYGRNTEIKASDIDLLMEIPISYYNKMKPTGQKLLLEQISTDLALNYKSANIYPDGQIISVNFKKVKFEVLPAFLNRKMKPPKYIYPNINNGGEWCITNPTSEIIEFNKLHTLSKMKLKRLCWLIRSWKYYNEVDIKGITIDCHAFSIVSKYISQGIEIPPYSRLCQEFFVTLLKDNMKVKWEIPGSMDIIIDRGKYYKDVEKAAGIIEYAISNEIFVCESINAWKYVLGTNFGITH